ncbi:unnamed protein product [Rotaria magnacalcarata]|uniref:Uncharacterized protein n=2 Tax=Rotaria magnacalcarata TaxID=392030 RepID=A0A816Q673_9BILA|nr:unnamed protein product [Rotaria magnacalcarata]CAF4842127.1 unnamed protein product [Rotaria magnacalcarata]
MSLSNVPKLQELYFHPWKLPLETLPLVDDQFYSFIEYLVGSTLSNLLRVQEINSVPILLLTTDVFKHLFLKINDVETDLLRQELLLQIDNNNLIVKSANRTKIKCLFDILKITSDRIFQEGQRIATKHQINYSSFAIPSATPAVSTANTYSTLTVDDQRNSLLKCIDDWSSLNETFFNLKEFKLEEGNNFRLIVKAGTNGIQASIECLCKTIITLGKLHSKLIPSNFYRHLKSPGCKYVNRLLKEQKLEETNRNNSYSTTSSSSSSQLIDNNSQSTTAVVPNRKRTLGSTHKIKSKKQRKN